MDTYEEVMRRNEPKNYTVRSLLVDGKTEDAYHFESLESAQMYASAVEEREYVEEVLILRSGRHPDSSGWTPTRKERHKIIRKPNDGIQVVDEAWQLPAGFVDGDADKHGPVVLPKTEDRLPPRTNAEKAAWARNNKFDDRTCLWQ